MTTAYPHLFSPLRVGARILANRIALPATLTNYGAAQRVTDRWIEFLAERARGGAGLVVSEIIAVDPEALAHGAIVVGYDDRNDEDFRRAAAAVEGAGACLVGQLWHPGRQQLWHPTRAPQGVSDQPDALSWTVPRVMNVGEIRRLVEAYVAVAERLARSGFGGVELHGAHGYLMTQFLSPWSNTREDDYGGDRERRVRFVLDVAEGIRQRCGADFVVGLKMPADEGVAGGIDVEEAAGITDHLASRHAVDYFAYGQGNFSLSLETHVPDMHYRPGHYIDLHKAMREAAGGIPVMALGRIGTPALAEKVVAEGYGDLVGMSRALIADAAFAEKARTGREDEIRPCIYNNWCWGQVHAGKPLLEFHNPHLAERGEAHWTPPRTAASLEVVVVGAGVAGLEAAWVAAASGHRVTVLGASDEVGGKARLEARLPGHAEVARVYADQRRRAEAAGVRFELGSPATPEQVRALQPDRVVVATGAGMRAPDWSDATGVTVCSAHDLARRAGSAGMPAGRVAVLFDHDHTAATYAAVLALATTHERTVLVTPRTTIAQAVNYCSALGIFRRLYAAGVEIVPASEIASVGDAAVTLRNVFSGAESGRTSVDTVVYSTPRRAATALLDALADLDPIAVGDCASPRDMMIAIHEGHAAALAL